MDVVGCPEPVTLGNPWVTLGSTQTQCTRVGICCTRVWVGLSDPRVDPVQALVAVAGGPAAVPPSVYSGGGAAAAVPTPAVVAACFMSRWPFLIELKQY